jgi:putative ABC transport system permease protein
MRLIAGRRLEPADRGVTLVGADLAERYDVGVGDTLDIRGEDFEVVGVLDRTFVNLMDASGYVSLADAQELYHATIPAAFRSSVSPEDMILQATILVEPGTDPVALAAEINREVEGVVATSGPEMMEAVDGLVILINAAVFGVAALALLIGGLSIVNTMTMSVGERTREIGVKRALGASRWRIARDVLAESAVIGLLGGIVGLLLGVAVASLFDAAIVAETGTTILVLTGRLAVGAVLFALVLGALGGLYPALHASRIDPATALARE